MSNLKIDGISFEKYNVEAEHQELKIDGISFEKYNVEAEHQELKMQGFTIEATDNTRDYVPFMFYGVSFEEQLVLNSLDVLFFAQL